MSALPLPSPIDQGQLHLDGYAHAQTSHHQFPGSVDPSVFGPPSSIASAAAAGFDDPASQLKFRMEAPQSASSGSNTIDPSHSLSAGPATAAAATRKMSIDGSNARNAGARASAQPYLKKQQACLTCKRRKTRCDAARPTCGACSRSQARAARGHALTAEVPPGPCTYPDDEALPIAASAHGAIPTSPVAPEPAQAGNQPPPDYGDEDQPNESIWATQDFPLAALTQPSPSTRSSASSGSFSNPSNVPANAVAGSLPGSSTSPSDASNSDTKTERVVLEVRSTSGGRARIRRFYHNGPTSSEGNPAMDLNNLMEPSDNVDFEDPTAAESLPQVDMLLRQMWPELSPDLPTPNTIRHMAELFLAKHPLRHMFCKSTLMARLKLPPNHPLRPHPSLLHALLAAAEPYSPLVPKMPDANPLLDHSEVGPNPDDVFANHTGPMPTFSVPGASTSTFPHQNATSVGADIEAKGRGFLSISNTLELPRPDLSKQLSFGDFHLAKARREIEVAILTQNQRPTEWMQAGVLIQYCLIERCRIMEGFFLSAALIRTIAPSGLDKLPNERVTEQLTRAMFGPATDSILEYEQRMAMWQVFLVDVYGAGSPKFYEPLISNDVEQITTSLPFLMDDVGEDTELQLSTQTLASPDLWYSGHTDAFCLHIKSAYLLKQARTIASRRGAELQRMARPPEQVLDLDRKAVQFLRSFPKSDNIDADWIVSEANACVARITLHQHFVHAATDDDNSYGRAPIEEAVQTMLKTIHGLLASSFDLSLLHTQTFICWVVLVRTLEIKARILQRFQQTEAAQQVAATVEPVMQALKQASQKSFRAKTSLDICQAAVETDLSDDEFADLLYLWAVIPAA